MLENFKKYDQCNLTHHEADYFIEGELPEYYSKGDDYSNVLFVKRISELSVSSVFTIEKSVPIYHGCLHNDVIEWLTNEEVHKRIKEQNDFPHTGIVINQCFGTGPTNAIKRYNEMRMEHNIYHF